MHAEIPTCFPRVWSKAIDPRGNFAFDNPPKEAEHPVLHPASGVYLALGGRCSKSTSAGGCRNVECVGRTSVIATSGSTDASGFARRWRRVACGYTGCSRRRRLHKSVASANLTTSIEGVALATFTAWAAALR